MNNMTAYLGKKMKKEESYIKIEFDDKGFSIEQSIHDVNEVHILVAVTELFGQVITNTPEDVLKTFFEGDEEISEIITTGLSDKLH